jgi:hypothetical protein
VLHDLMIYGPLPFADRPNASFRWGGDHHPREETRLMTLKRRTRTLHGTTSHFGPQRLYT